MNDLTEVSADKKTPSISSMRIVDAINVDDFNSQCLIPEEPAIIKGIARDWAAMQKWDWDFFTNCYGTSVVPLSYYKTRGQERFTSQEKAALGSYLSKFRDPRDEQTGEEDPYVAGWNFIKDHPELADDFNRSPPCFPDNWLPKIPSSISLPTHTLFFGHSGVSTPLHTDSFFVHTWLTMIVGSKTVRMVAPKDSNKVENGMDLFNPDTADAVLRGGAKIFEGTACEADAIYIPPGWWHNVINGGTNIAVQSLYVDVLRFPVFEQQIRRLILPTLQRLSAVGKEARSAALASSQVHVRTPAHGISDFQRREEEYLEFLADARADTQAYLEELLRPDPWKHTK